MMFDNRCFKENEYIEHNECEHKYEQNMVGNSTCMEGCVCPTVYECPKENCIHRTIIHEVPHVQNINTKVINHHIYKHTYMPCYTMSECDTCEQVFDGCMR